MNIYGMSFCYNRIMCFYFCFVSVIYVAYLSFFYFGWLLQLMEEEKKKALKALQVVVHTS